VRRIAAATAGMQVFSRRILACPPPELFQILQVAQQWRVSRTSFEAVVLRCLKSDSRDLLPLLPMTDNELRT
jgi:hypothetical protein